MGYDSLPAAPPLMPTARNAETRNVDIPFKHQLFTEAERTLIDIF